MNSAGFPGNTTLPRVVTLGLTAALRGSTGDSNMKEDCTSLKYLLLALALCLVSVGTAGAQVAEVSINPDKVHFSVFAENDGLVLSLAGPCGVTNTQWERGEDPVITIVDAKGNVLDDGSYTWQIDTVPYVDPELRGQMKTAREKGNDAEFALYLLKEGLLPQKIHQFGYLTVLEGRFVLPGNEKELNGDQDVSDPYAKDFVINDDLIVDGSACIGFDCVNGESFSFDTIRLKENNLRIKFDDTSIAASFPRTDWQLTANSSANGGASKFSIDDISGSRTPFTVEANAPSHSLYVDDGGRIGNVVFTKVDLSKNGQLYSKFREKTRFRQGGRLQPTKVFTMLRRLTCVLIVLCGVGWTANLPAQQQSRKLAPGVLTVVSPAPVEGETFTGPLPIVELTNNPGTPDWTPNYETKLNTLLERAKRATMRRRIWNLEFAFKPLRMIEIEVPQPSLKMQRKLVWYMVYRVRYVGSELEPSAETDAWNHTTFPTTARINRQSRLFFPTFVLRAHEFNKSYLDRVIPAAIGPIQNREMRGQKLYNTVEITKVPIPLTAPDVDRGVWGVVTWEDVDPRIDYLSIFIQGLTNAYIFQDKPGAFRAGDPPGTGRQYAYKTLQLNFWRPGDTRDEHEREIRFGVPIYEDPAQQQQILQIYGIDERLDYLWVYR